MAQSPNVDVRLVEGGIALSSTKEALPVNSIIWVSEIVLPSFPNMDKVFNIRY